MNITLQLCVKVTQLEVKPFIERVKGMLMYGLNNIEVEAYYENQ